MTRPIWQLQRINFNSKREGGVHSLRAREYQLTSPIPRHCCHGRKPRTNHPINIDLNCRENRGRPWLRIFNQQNPSQRWISGSLWSEMSFNILGNKVSIFSKTPSNWTWFLSFQIDPQRITPKIIIISLTLIQINNKRREKRNWTKSSTEESSKRSIF